MEDRRHKIGLVVLIVIVCWLPSCINPIPFEADTNQPDLVIFGSFTDLAKEHEVTIRRTGKFGRTGTAVSGATVEILDSEGNKSQYYESGEGKYILSKGDLAGIPGRAYKLIITLPNQEIYESSWEEMPEPVQIESTDFEIHFRKQLSESNNLIQQFFIEVYIDTPLKTNSGSSAFLRWETEETYSFTDFQCGGLDGITVCYYEVPNEFGKLELFSATDDSQKKLEKHLIFSRSPSPNIEFIELHYFTVYQHSISESTFDYWEKVNIVSNPTGSVFDKLPASIPGNFTEVDGSGEVFGYFEVASVSVGRTVTSKRDIDQFIQIPQACLWYRPPQFQPDYCCYCFLLPNTIPKPDYWGDR